LPEAQTQDQTKFEPEAERDPLSLEEELKVFGEHFPKIAELISKASRYFRV
jgi:hypothetical protein